VRGSFDRLGFDGRRLTQPQRSVITPSEKEIVEVRSAKSPPPSRKLKFNIRTAGDEPHTERHLMSITIATPLKWNTTRLITTATAAPPEDLRRRMGHTRRPANYEH